MTRMKVGISEIMCPDFGINMFYMSVDIIAMIYHWLIW